MIADGHASNKRTRLHRAGREERFPSYRVYITTMIGMMGVYFYVAVYILRRWLGFDPNAEKTP